MNASRYNLHTIAQAIQAVSNAADRGRSSPALSCVVMWRHEHYKTDALPTGECLRIAATDGQALAEWTLHPMCEDDRAPGIDMAALPLVNSAADGPGVGDAAMFPAASNVKAWTKPNKGNPASGTLAIESTPDGGKASPAKHRFILTFKGIDGQTTLAMSALHAWHMDAEFPAVTGMPAVAVGTAYPKYRRVLTGPARLHTRQTDIEGKARPVRMGVDTSYLAMIPDMLGIKPKGTVRGVAMDLGAHDSMRFWPFTNRAGGEVDKVALVMPIVLPE